MTGSTVANSSIGGIRRKLAVAIRHQNNASRLRGVITGTNRTRRQIPRWPESRRSDSSLKLAAFWDRGATDVHTSMRKGGTPAGKQHVIVLWYFVPIDKSMSAIAM